ncbi:MAG: hypothetical protein HQ521_04590, partial [Bacteroidetes bacterium]|nr:hypothetical protein [Bacteroidota bacterium]
DWDDYLEPNAIELLYNSMIKDDGDIVVGACVYENEFGERITEWNSYLLGTSQADYLKSMFRLQLQLNIWGRLIRREIFDVVNIPDHFFGGEDIIANTMMICYNKNLKIRTIDNCIYHYLVRKESLTNSISPSEFMDYTVEVEKILIETNFEELVMKEWAYYMIVSAWRKYLRKGGRRFLKDKVFVKNLYGKYFDLIKQDLDFFERFELFLFKLNPTIARLVSRTLFKLSVLK